MTLYINAYVRRASSSGFSKGHGLKGITWKHRGGFLPWVKNSHAKNGVFRRIVGVALVWLGCTASLGPATIIHAERMVETNLFGRRCNMVFPV